MEAINNSFADIARNADLCANHAFDSGDDLGAYINFTFGTLLSTEIIEPD